ncbi:MAG: pyrroline-5-carboxylate reductase [Desulfovibrio sp.]|jgi:pyrroline-5-carboxylate reductase|nr:pyrroline-5-carboxylate reductase [Desulfovibrio sp.]
MRMVGCIGCGNMGGAILGGLADSLGGKGYAFCGHTRTPGRMALLTAKGVSVRPDAQSLVRDADVIVLAVKPYQIAAIVKEILPALSGEKLLISIAAGVGLKRLKELCRGLCPVARCMPNTPAIVGQGIFALCLEDDAMSRENRDEAVALFNTLGLCIPLPETQFTAFSALIGAGPAYVFQMMQGMVQAGVTLGFAHQEARKLVTALFASSARLAGERPEHLAQLRDTVCSPGGLTIAGVNVLDRAGIVGVLVDAVLAADKRGREMEE